VSKRFQDGRWFDVATKEQHDCLKRYGALAPPRQPWGARVQIGEWAGPGRYLLLQYHQRCPRNCCDDDVNNVYSAAEVAEAVRDDIRELAGILREARKELQS
jgi:hypothetical protein